MRDCQRTKRRQYKLDVEGEVIRARLDVATAKIFGVCDMCGDVIHEMARLAIKDGSPILVCGDCHGR